MQETRGVYLRRMLHCKKCNKLLTGNQTSYCSLRCSKLHLKSLYKKRNKEKVSAYNRAFRMKAIRKPLDSTRRNEILESDAHLCARCGTRASLNVHHIVPLSSGGPNHERNLVTFCFKCHMEWHKRLGDFWGEVK